MVDSLNHSPGPSEADHHFVGDVDDPVLSTQLPNTFEVAGGGGSRPSADHRLEHQRGDRRRQVFHGDHVREVVERPLGLLVRRRGTRTRSGRAAVGPKKCTAPAAPVSVAQRR